VLEEMDFTGQIHRLCTIHYKTGTGITGDKGFHSPAGLAIIQEETGARTIIGDPNAARRGPANPEPEARRAVDNAARAVKTKTAKRFLKCAACTLRGFRAYPRLRRAEATTLRGIDNISKRYLRGILAFNLSLIMRKLTGVGTPRQAAASFLAIYVAGLALLSAVSRHVILKVRRAGMISALRPGIR